MKPILFSIGQIPIHSYGFSVAFGVLVSVYLMTRYYKQYGFQDFDFVLDLVFVTLASGFLGGRIYYVIQNFAWYQSAPLEVFAIWEGGLIFYGGVFGALAGLYFFSRKKKIPFFRILDWLLPYVALTHAFGRVGCFLNGCCGGKFCEYPWCFQTASHLGSAHPAQLYEAFYLVALAAFLSWKQIRKSRPGEISAYYFSLYGAGRFAIEFFRDGNPGFLGLTFNQWLGLLFALGIPGFILFKKYQARKSVNNMNPF